MATYILKRVFQRLFSGIGRSGYPSDYIPNELDNPQNLPIKINVTRLEVFNEDLSILPKKLKNRVKDLIDSIISGYIYENNPDDPDEYTHARSDINNINEKYKIYSKDVDNEHRFIYGVRSIKNKIIDGILTKVVEIKLIGCSEHDSIREIKDRISGTMSYGEKQRRKNRPKFFTEKE